jgi:hypothetical protein
MKSWLQIYAALMSAVSSIALMVSLAIALNNVADLVFLEDRFIDSLSVYSSNKAFLDNEKSEYLKEANSKNFDLLQDPKITKERLEKRDEYMRNRRVSTKMNMLTCLIWITVTFLFMVIHLRILRKYERNK